MLLFAGCGGTSSQKSTTGGGGGGGTTETPFVVAIEVQPAAPTLSAGSTVQLSATGIFSDGTTQDFSTGANWSSNNTSIVTVNSSGLATGGSTSGTTYISATSNSVTGFTMLSVGAPPSSGTVSFYVSPSGNDNNSGTSSSAPFATLDRARRAVAGRAGSVVQFADGIYYSSSTTFSSSDSGTASNPIIYEAAPGAHPVISGGIQITGWTNSSGDGKTWTASVTGRQNFEGLHYQPAGASDMERRFRPRTTVNAPCTTYPCPSSYLYLASNNPVVVSQSTPNCSVQVSNGFQCYDQFYFNSGDVAASYHGEGLGDVEILDFEKWTMSRLRILSVNASTDTVTLTSPTLRASEYGFFPNHRYLIENCDPNIGRDPTCQQQVPGQWYLDRCPGCASTATTPATTWTLTYYSQPGENPPADTIIAPQQAQLIVATSASNIVFQGLSFSNDDWYPSNISGANGGTCTGVCGLGDNSGIPGVPAAVSFTNAQGVIFNGCTFAHTQGWGLEFEGSSSGNEVINSAFYDIGAGALRIGQYPTGSDSDATVPQYNLIENNIIQAGGRVQPSGLGTGVWVGNAHNNVIAYNEISDFYNGAIGLGFTAGTNPVFAHDNVVAYNQLFNLGQGVTSDMGGVHFAAAGSGGFGNMMVNNIVHDVQHNYLDPDGYGSHGAYLDQSEAQSVAHDNIMYRIGESAVFDNLTTAPIANVSVLNNVVLNNIMAYTRQFVVQRGGNIPYSFSFVRNIAYYDMGTVQGGHWYCPHGSCTNQFFFDFNDYWDLSGSPQFYTTTNNGTSPSSNYNLSQWQGLGEDTHSISADPMFVSPGSDFTLQAGSPALASPINFQPITGAPGLLNKGPTFKAPPALPQLSDCQNLAAGASQPAGACPAFPLELLSASDY